MKNFLLLSFCLLAMFSCSPKKFITQDYYDYASTHQKIAILPYENYYTGRIPKNLTEEQIMELQIEEAILFQRSLYFQLLEESRVNRNRSNIQVSIQNIEKTNKILFDNDIDIEDSWFKSPEELAQILGVDAVVKVDVHKDFWMTNTESLILDVASSITGLFIPGLDPKTSQVYINANLIDGQAGLSLWSWNRRIDTDWQRETEEAIARVNHQISKRFPYRERI